MSKEKLTQAEIDMIVEGHQDGIIPEFTDSELNNIKGKYKPLQSAIARLDYARKNLSFAKQREAEKAVRHAAFDLWLANRRMKKRDYYQMMNRELAKRGCRAVFPVYPYRKK